MFRHPVKQRIKIREKAVGHKRKGKITGHGTVHAPSPEIQEKYAEAVHLYSTPPMSASRIAKMTGVSRKGFYEYLHRWHMDLICKRKNIPYEEGMIIEWSKVQFRDKSEIRRSHQAAEKHNELIREGKNQKPL